MFKSQGRRNSKKQLGNDAEQRAEKFLQAQGLIARQRNYRCKLGEIDLVMSDGEYLVFVEVRLRRNPFFASALESVDWHKQQKLVRAAHHYLLQHRLTERTICRFDVVALDGPTDNDITWLQNAFGDG